MADSKSLYEHFHKLCDWVVKEYNYYTYKCSKIHPSTEDEIRCENLRKKKEQLHTIIAEALQEYFQHHPQALDNISQDYN